MLQLLTGSEDTQHTATGSGATSLDVSRSHSQPLVPGTKYGFIVAAENSAGVGTYTASQVTVAPKASMACGIRIE